MDDLRLVSKEFLQAWFFLSAFGTADMGSRHIDQVLAAESGYFDMPIQAKQAFLNSGLQDEIRAVVSPENAGHGTVCAVLGLPGRRAGIAVN